MATIEAIITLPPVNKKNNPTATEPRNMVKNAVNKPLMIKQINLFMVIIPIG